MTTRNPWIARVGVTMVILAGAAVRAEETVSYDKQVRPILQARCQGCHQPAKQGGGYVMTAFDRLTKGGESSVEAIIAGKPEESALIDQVTPGADGKAKMPKDGPCLTPAEIGTITKWIAQGAHDDTPASAVSRIDQEHPPEYSRPPVIPTLDFAPDGSLLAVAGFHEVLLWKADGSELVARLVGLSERIESLSFSPDGTKLAVAGGLPARMGEVQVWDVAKRKLVLSVPVTSDTVYGVSWSPDGTRIAFGCADNTVRAIDAKTGQQVLFSGAHNDWALDTVWSADGSHLISVSRDMSTKLTEVATQRFVDNITSITPGALKGGILSVARYPRSDEIVIGGSDGIPKVYRVFRVTARVIGDDANLIRNLPAMTGRVYSVAVCPDGHRIAAGSSLDGQGQVNVYASDFDTALPDKVKAIQAKVVDSRSAEEKAELERFHNQSVKLLASVPIPQGGVYAVAFQPDGQIVAAAGSDGTVRLIHAGSGKVVKEFVPAPINGSSSVDTTAVAAVPGMPEEAATSEQLPPGVTLAEIQVQPSQVVFQNRFAYTQLVVTGKTASGETLDITRMVESKVSADVAGVSPSGLVRPKADGQATLTVSLGGKSAQIPVTVNGVKTPVRVDFAHDVAPVLSRLGCNQGTCHGSAQGKNGFKLSLRGYDSLFDVRALTDDQASRRVNLASPEDSLMLDKPTGGVPHVGGVLTRPGEVYYEVLRDWIAQGAKLDTTVPRVARIEVFPTHPVVPLAGAKQQLQVLATYASGEVRDVTREAFLESGNIEVATANKTGIMTALRRGEAPVLARYEGAYAAATLTVMGDRSGFAWQDPPTYGKIDELVAAKWKQMKILPSEVCTDAEFLRRVHLDLTGLPPTADEVRAFLADPKDSHAKRDAVVDQLIGSPEYVDYWTNKWADLLQVNRKFLDVDGATAYRAWLREQVDKNVPYDQFVRSIITASGSTKANPAASYYKILREPAPTMETTTQLFLAVRFNCNKCHDHPFERWTQDQYYQTAAYFAQVGLKGDPASNGRMVGGSAVEGAQPVFEIVEDTGQGEMIHDRTKQVSAPKLPFACKYETPQNASRRQELAAWLTSVDNPYFARSYVNRLWGYLLGVGIIEPLDDIRAGNPATNPELLDYLTKEFLGSGFNSRHVMRLICMSRTYQLSVTSNKWNADDKTNYSHATARRLPAEVLLDAVYRATGTVSKIPGVAPGTRAAALPDSGVELPSGFLATFGRPARESACECERSSGLQLGPVMALVSGPTLGDAIADSSNELTKLVSSTTDDAALVNELFLRILNRPAKPEEITACLKSFEAVDDDHKRLSESLGAREVEVALERPQLERQHEADVAAAKAALDSYEHELAPKLAEQEAQHTARIAQAEADLKTFDSTDLPARIAEWEKKQNLAQRWVVLDPQSLQASNGATLAKEADGSIVASGGDDRGVITFVAETDLKDITGLRVEMVADARFPSKGPGRAPDGNFVLNELQVSAAPKSDAKQAKPVVLQNPLADFSQASFEVAKAIDGQADDPNNGWALSPATGVTHWATFETKDAVSHEGGTVLTITLHHKYNKGFMPGRFRIAVTQAARPVGLDLADEYRAILATAPEARSDAQRTTLLAYFHTIDGEYRKRVDAVNVARAPLPIDPKLQELRTALEAAQKPVPLDPRLVQVRHDLEQSVQQSASRRLTAAQDITRALINSPAFLFNH